MTAVGQSAKLLCERYDYERSTQANHTVPSDDPSGDPAGRYIRFRNGLDLAYHGRYHSSRQRLQDLLIQQTLATGRRYEEPWLIFTAGPMGAGKSHVIQWMHDHGFFLMHHIVHCDPDVFKAALPEWQGYVARNQLTAGQLTHRESGMLVEIATEAALAAQMHCWVDGSLKDGAWYRQVLEDVRTRYPQYSIAILEVTAEADVIFQRVEKRAAETGRGVPREDVLDSIARVPKSVAALCDLVDFFARIDNSGSGAAAPPRLTKFCDCEQCYLMSTWEEAQRGWSEIQRRFGTGSAPGRSLRRTTAGSAGSMRSTLETVTNVPAALPEFQIELKSKV